MSTAQPSSGALSLPGQPGPGNPAGPPHGAAIALSPFAVLLAAALLAAHCALSARLSLGLHKALAVSAARCALSSLRTDVSLAWRHAP
jgi:hypothetical protein